MSTRWRRKEGKKAAKASLKKHYWILVVLCLFASFLGMEYGTSFVAVRMQLPKNNANSIMTELLTDQEEAARSEVAEKEELIKEQDTNAYLGRSRGVLSSIVNSYSSGSFLISAAEAVQNMVGSGSLYMAIMIFGALVVYYFIWFFIKETYLIITRRIVLESRIYEKIPMRRFLYPVQTKKWAKMAWTMMVKACYTYLWSLTVIGGIIKKYSYSMVPYILAENPDIGANEAITLSRRMMKGHKWEYFVAEVSFLGWQCLNILTLGISGIFYSNPYKAATFGEFYTYVRTLAKENEISGVEKLCDHYLFQKPESDKVAAVYSDLSEFVDAHADVKVTAPKGILGILSNWFGILLFPSESVKTYEKERADQYRARQIQDILSGNVYPGRMAPAVMSHKVEHTTRILPTKSYTLLNLILMFFIISFIGWIWEVSLHLISDGVFVNRGTMHGPWLPIYGTGGVLILIVLKKLRENPAIEFIAAMTLCGCIEYYSAWNLARLHDGQKWWDYSGYFLNIHGRVCAEGLLVFGLGGLAIVYVLAPFLDNLLNKMNRKMLAAIAAILLIIYVGDKMYSAKYPNMGEGITTVSMYLEEERGQIGQGGVCGETMG